MGLHKKSDKYIKSLMKKYKPSDTIAEAEVSAKLNKVDELSDRIAAVVSQYTSVWGHD